MTSSHYDYPGRLPASWEEEQQQRAGQASGDSREPRTEKGSNRVPAPCPGRGERLDDIGNADRLLAGAAYRPDADAPTWRAHLERCQPDPDVRAFLQRLAGYSAIGDTQKHIIAISHGAGANGKSTTHNATNTVLGDYGHQAAVDLLTQPRHGSGQARPELADLRGRRLVIVAETREDHRLPVERVKAIGGGDPITARHLYGNPFTFQPSHTVWLQTNHKPRISDDGHAIWRRVQLIPWPITIPDQEQDPAIDQQLASELDGILAWIVQGALTYQKRGLDPPSAITAATHSITQCHDRRRSPPHRWRGR